MPPPIGLHRKDGAPFVLATLAMATPPMLVKAPPTIRVSDPPTASDVRTATSMIAPCARIEVAQDEPFQRSSTPCADDEPEPATINSPSNETIASTSRSVGGSGSVLQVTPFQAISVGVVTPPTNVRPAATSVPFHTVSASTGIGKPVPSGCQADPSHRAR